MDDIRTPLPCKPVRFLDQLRLAVRQQGLSLQTEKTYLYCVKYYIHFHKKCHPREVDA